MDFILKNLQGKEGYPMKYDGEEYEAFLGTIAGAFQGIGDVVRESDPRLYSQIINVIENLSLR